MDALSMKDCDLILSGHKAPDSGQGEASSKSGLSGVLLRCWPNPCNSRLRRDWNVERWTGADGLAQPPLDQQKANAAAELSEDSTQTLKPLAISWLQAS